MKQRRPLAALLLAAIAALALVGPASAAELRDGEQEERRLATLEANLTGEKEVPGPGDPNGVGNAVVKVFSTKVCSTLEVKRIEPASGAHIHLGFRGEAGPIVATLKPPTDGLSRGCVEIPRALSQGLREHPSRYYVNVHNAEYPAGALRGQLRK